MVSRDEQPKGFISSLRKVLAGSPGGTAGQVLLGPQAGAAASVRRDPLALYQPAVLDLDPLAHPTKHRHPPVPQYLRPGVLLVSRRHGAKCIVLDSVDDVDITVVKGICLRRSELPCLISYMPVRSMTLPGSKE